MDTLIYALIVIGVLVLGIFLVVTLKGKGVGIIDFVKDLFRFGGG